MVDEANVEVVTESGNTIVGVASFTGTESQTIETVEGTVEVNEVGADQEVFIVELIQTNEFYPLRNTNSKRSCLRTPCSEVTEFNEELKFNLERLAKTMKKYNGYGLSAPQCSIPKRYFVYNTDGSQGYNVVVNPKMMDCSDPVWSKEGCLSIPFVQDKVLRFKKIHLEYQNETGETFQKTFEGLEAVCIQHEMDHLIGILFIDRLSKLKRDMAFKKYTKRMKEVARQQENLSRQFSNGTN